MNNLVAEATMVECNHGGIEVAKVTSKSLWWRRNWGDDAITEWKEAEIHYSDTDNDGEKIEDEQELQYFTIGNVDENGKEWKYFLNEFLMIQR